MTGYAAVKGTEAMPQLDWPLERVLFALAGTMTLLSSGLAAIVSPWFLVLGAVVGVNQWLFVLLGACPASMALRRLFSMRSVIPRADSSVGPQRRSESVPSCRARVVQPPDQGPTQ